MKFGSGYDESIIVEHRRNLEPGKIGQRLAFDRRFAAYCHSAFIELTGKLPSEAASLSLGCGLGFDVLELLALGYDAYGLETADLSSLWRDCLGAEAHRCVLHTDGLLPFPDDSFDLITSVNVFEHVGTIPPKELVTDGTFPARFNFIRQAITKLKPGGLFVLTCSNRAYPFDSGHSHHYIPDSHGQLSRHGYTPTDPWHPMNFLPSVSDLRAICSSLSEQAAITVRFLTDSYLFGDGGPEKQSPEYSGSMSAHVERWAIDFHEPPAISSNPHIQAFIRKCDAPMTPLTGSWSVTWTLNGDTYVGTLTRLALLPDFMLSLRHIATGGIEGDLCKLIAPSIVRSSGGTIFDLENLIATPPIGIVTIDKIADAFWL